MVLRYLVLYDDRDLPIRSTAERSRGPIGSLGGSGLSHATLAQSRAESSGVVLRSPASSAIHKPSRPQELQYRTSVTYHDADCLSHRSDSPKAHRTTAPPHHRATPKSFFLPPWGTHQPLAGHVGLVAARPWRHRSETNPHMSRQSSSAHIKTPPTAIAKLIGIIVSLAPGTCRQLRFGDPPR